MSCFSFKNNNLLWVKTILDNASVLCFAAVYGVYNQLLNPLVFFVIVNG